MSEWHDEHHDEYYEFSVPNVELYVEDEDCQVLYGPDGSPMFQITKKLPFGFHN